MKTTRTLRSARITIAALLPLALGSACATTKKAPRQTHIMEKTGAVRVTAAELGGVPASTAVIETASSAITLFKAPRTFSVESPGSRRQFTLAAASCGSALRACPPSSIVATQVVRNCAL